MSSVPVANVYYMLLYAWKLIGQRDPAAVTREGYTELKDLFAHVLADTVEELLARGLDRGYVTRDEPVYGVRGRLELAESLKRNLLPVGQAHCRFDELEYDVLHNRIVKSTLRRLLDVRLHEKNHGRVLALYQKLDAVADVEVAGHEFGLVQLHRNNAVYEYALRLCELIHDNLMVDPRTGRTSFREYNESRQQQLGRLFEEFVRAWFDRHLAGFTRAGDRGLRWFGTGRPADWAFLPRMETDIVLESAERRVILDAKFYADSRVGGSGKNRKVIPEHLYQLLAYVQNRDAHHPGAPHEGILLYPVVENAFRLDYELLGHRFAIRSIDLRKPWPAIHQDMLAIL